MDPRRDEADAPMPDDERLIALLVAYDEALVEGSQPSVAADANQLDAATAERLKRAQSVLDRLNKARRESVGAPYVADFDLWSGVRHLLGPEGNGLGASSTSHKLGRFEILRELGHGAHGLVFLAHDPVLRRHVALKVPRPDALMSPKLRQRFLREAQAAARLTHPNLVAVHEVGEVGPICYIASAYCQGQTLAAWLDKRVPLPDCRLAAQWVAELADAVHYAHTQGVLHRDLKPGNVILEPIPAEGNETEGSGEPNHGPVFQPKLTDFGLAKLVEGDGNVTCTGTLLGTPAYMAPEQALGQLDLIDVRTDVYALGAMLYEILTGRAAFLGSNDVDTLRRVVDVDPIRPMRMRRDVSRDLEAICLKCLEKSPERRYPSASAVAADLRNYLAGEPTVARPIGPLRRAGKWARRRPAAAALVAVCALGAVSLSVGSAFYSYQLNRALRIADQERTIADDLREEAETRERHLRERTYARYLASAHLAWRDNDVWRAAELLRQAASPTEGLGQRTFAWRMLRRRYCTQSVELGRHSSDCYYGIYAPAGDRFATAGRDGNIKIWNARTESLERSWQGHAKEVNCLQFSPDGQTLYSASDDRSIRSWDVESGKQLGSYDGHEDLVLSIALSPDGTLIGSSSKDQTVRLWDVETRAQLARFEPGNVGDIWSVAFAPDGKLLASGGTERAVYLWNVPKRRLRNIVPLRQGVLSLAFSPRSGTIAVGCNDSTVRIIDIAGGVARNSLRTHTGSIQHVAYSPDGSQIIAAGAQGVVYAWDAEDLELRRAYLAHRGRVWSASMSPDNSCLLSTGAEGDVRICHLARHDDRRVLPTAGRDGLWISPDGKLLRTLDPLGRVGLHDDGVEDVLDAGVAAGHRITCQAVTSEGDVLILGDSTKRLRFWNRRDRSPLGDAVEMLHAPRRLACSPGGRFLAVGLDNGEVQLWDARTRTPLTSLSEASSAEPISVPVESVSFSRDGRLLAVTWFDRRQVTVLSTPELRRVSSLESDVAGHVGVAFCDEGQRAVTGGNEAVLKLWDVATGELVREIASQTAPFQLMTLSSDETTVVTYDSFGMLKLWDLASGLELMALDGAVESVGGLALSDSGTVAVVSGPPEEARLHFWRVTPEEAADPPRR